MNNEQIGQVRNEKVNGNLKYQSFSSYIKYISTEHINKQAEIIRHSKKVKSKYTISRESLGGPVVI